MDIYIYIIYSYITSSKLLSLNLTMQLKLER